MLMQAVVESLFKLLDFAYLKKLYHRYKIRKNRETHLYNQEEMNEIFEGPELELRSYFADVIMIFLVGSFSWSFCPIAVLLTIFGLVCFYWILKLSLLRRCVVQKHQCDKAIHLMLNIVCAGPLLYLIMVFLMAKTTTFCSEYSSNDNEQKILNIILYFEIALFFIIALVPTQKFITWHIDEIEETYDKVYEESDGNYNHLQRILKG